MSRTLAVAARELRERWLLLPAGLVIGLAPLFVTSFGLRSEQAPVMGLVLAVLMGAVAAGVTGSSMLARDAADGRLAFLFSRPVSWTAIWGGKWLAAVLLVFGSGFLALVPVIMAYAPPSPTGSWRSVLLGPDGSAVFLILLLLGIGFANFNATAFRSRAAWLALDLGFLLLALWLTWRWVAPLFVLLIVRHGTTWRWVVLLAVPALALLAASAAQVGIGRTDLRRAHRALSVTFWGLVFVVLGAAGLRLAWARAATPADLTGGYVGGSSDPSGRWLYVRGESIRGGAAIFLVDTDQGRYLPMGVGVDALWAWRLSPGMAFAADGGSGAVLQRQPTSVFMWVVKFGGEVPRFTRVLLESSPPADFHTRYGLSPSGATAILAQKSRISLFEIPSGRRLATTSNPPGWRPAAVRFLGEGQARVWLLPMLGLPFGSHPPAEMRIVDLAVDQETRTAVAPLETVVDSVRSWPHLVHPDDAGHRILTRDGALRLRDGATGALLATLHEGTVAYAEAFLADGRIVVGAAVGERTSLQVFSREGVLLRDMDIERPAAGLEVGPEVTPGRVAVAFGRVAGGVETLIVDVDRMRIVDTLPGLQPLWTPWGGDPLGAAGPNRGFFLEDGSVVRRDFATRERRVVAGPGAQPGERIRPAEAALD